MTLGSGAMTNTIADTTGESDLIMLVGSNPEEAHPVIGMQIRQAVQRGCKLIVVDPRDIDLAKKADVHIKLKPGTNVTLTRFFTYYVATEFGCTNMKGLSTWERAEAIINLAHPDFRDGLIKDAEKFGIWRASNKK